MEEIFSNYYQKLGDYFTGLRRWLFYAIVIVGLIIILAAEYFFHFNIEAETLFWVFSSIVQSLMALVAFMAVVVVSKYQTMLTREDRLLEELNKETSDLAKLGGNLTATSIEELGKNIDVHVPKVPSNSDRYRTLKLRRVKQEIESYVFLRSFLSDYMLRFTIYTFSVVVFDLLALILTTFLIHNSALAITVLYVSLFLVANTLRLVIKIIAETIS